MKQRRLERKKEYRAQASLSIDFEGGEVEAVGVALPFDDNGDDNECITPVPGSPMDQCPLALPLLTGRSTVAFRLWILKILSLKKSGLCGI